MIQVAQIPYRKLYTFPFFSDSMLLMSLVYAVIVLIPFFLVYSVNSTSPFTQISILPRSIKSIPIHP